MKLSVEAKVAAAVGGAFVALTIGTIAHGNSESETGGPNEYAPIDTPRGNRQVSEEVHNNSGDFLKSKVTKGHRKSETFLGRPRQVSKSDRSPHTDNHLKELIAREGITHGTNK